MKRKKSKSPILYVKYKQSQKEEGEIEKIAEKLEADKEKIVITHMGASAKLVDLLGGAARMLLRIIIIGAIFLLSSIGLTVLCNNSLREIFWETIMAVF